jgi:endonuclease/exonuclease/phosphatase family metal-dependent hydrolase
VNKANAMFRVMSYNIRNSSAKDGENCWTNRKELVASMIRFHHAGLVGMQEVLKDQFDDLGELLPEFGRIGVGRDDGKAAGEFAAIFYLKERFAVEASGHFWLSEHPDQPGVKGWDARWVRMVTWAKFSDQVTNKQFYHFNTHFDHVGEEAKRQSSYLLLNRVETIAGAMPLVVTGDFNCIPEGSVYRILTGEEACGNDFNGNYLIDSEAVSICKHHGPSTTTIENFDPEYTHKIDYIFIKNRVTALTHGILADHFDRRYSSDHMPVAADLIIEA